MNLGEYTKLKEQLAALESRVAKLEQKAPISPSAGDQLLQASLANRTLTLKHA